MSKTSTCAKITYVQKEVNHEVKTNNILQFRCYYICRLLVNSKNISRKASDEFVKKEFENLLNTLISEFF